MKTVKAPPGAKRLIESLRALGYDFSTAVADVIDNSLVARASEVRVEIRPRQGSRPAYVVIADNGRGLDRDSLVEAMRFGAHQEYAPEDLGKYGLGLKTASLSQCTQLTVASKPVHRKGSRPRQSILRWDLEHVYRKDDWELLEPDIGQLKDWEEEALDQAISGDHGTAVLWSGVEEVLPHLGAESEGRREQFLGRLIEDVSSHLRMVFHRFMQGILPDRKKLTLRVCDEVLTPWDPFCQAEPRTRQVDPKKFRIAVSLGAQKPASYPIVISPFILPREDEFSSKQAWREASGPRNWNQQQGFYFYRNDRLLQAGGWSYLRAADEHTKLLRVAVSFPGDLDQAFAINITKMRARIPEDIREEVKGLVSEWAKTARQHYDRASHRTTAGASATGRTDTSSATADAPAKELTLGRVTFSLTQDSGNSVEVVKAARLGHLTVSIPEQHHLSPLLNGSTAGPLNLKKFCLALFTLLEALADGKLKPSQVPLRVLKAELRRLT